MITIEILFLCTANQCRSPMAEALLGAKLAALGVAATVRSAGLLEGGMPAVGGSQRALGTRGLALDAHVSRTMTAAHLASADLVLAMARSHVREAVLALPAVWSRAFTLKELVRRGEAAGPRRHDQPLADWIAACGVGRQRIELIGDSPSDDVADPMGGPEPGYAATADELDRLLDRLVAVAFSSTRPTHLSATSPGTKAR